MLELATQALAGHWRAREGCQSLELAPRVAVDLVLLSGQLVHVGAAAQIVGRAWRLRGGRRRRRSHHHGRRAAGRLQCVRRVPVLLEAEARGNLLLLLLMLATVEA